MCFHARARACLRRARPRMKDIKAMAAHWHSRSKRHGNTSTCIQPLETKGPRRSISIDIIMGENATADPAIAVSAASFMCIGILLPDVPAAWPPFRRNFLPNTGIGFAGRSDCHKKCHKFFFIVPILFRHTPGMLQFFLLFRFFCLTLRCLKAPQVPAEGT